MSTRKSIITSVEAAPEQSPVAPTSTKAKVKPAARARPVPPVISTDRQSSPTPTQQDGEIEKIQVQEQPQQVEKAAQPSKKRARLEDEEACVENLKCLIRYREQLNGFYVSQRGCDWSEHR